MTPPRDRVRRVLHALVDGGAAVADLVLPRVCAGCQVPGAVLCPSCAGLLAVPHLAQPRRPPPAFPPTVAAGVYAGPVRPAVVAFKERGRVELVRPLGSALALAVAAVVAASAPGAGQRGRPVLLVPVPSSRAALRVRGRDHVGELARRAAAELRAAGIAARPAVLVARRGRSRDSAGLGAAERRANLAGAFEPARPGRPPPPGTVLVLVDDVVTSGATLTASALALARGTAGAGLPVLGAVVAATPRHLADPPAPVGARLVTLRR